MAQDESHTAPRIDRRVVIVGDLRDESAEREYWWAQTPQQRLAHVERLRRLNYGSRATEPLQRVLEYVQRTPR